MATGATLLEVQKAAVMEGTGSLGEPWAPSAELLRPALAERHRLERVAAEVDAIRKGWSQLPLGASPPPDEEQLAIALSAEAEGIESVHWEGYCAGFRAEMQVSYREKALAWGWLLTLPRVALACLCERPDRCHRSLVAAYFGKVGATVRGEL
jgi:hypothetical protein